MASTSTPKTDVFAGYERVLIDAIRNGLLQGGTTLKELTRDRIDERTIGQGDSRMIKSTDFSMNNRPATEAVFPRDAIRTPNSQYEMIFGVGVPYAMYVEKGAGPHTSGNSSVDPDGGTFIEKMKAWATRVGININTPEGKRQFENIVSHIQRNGTGATPFLLSEKQMSDIVNKNLAIAVKGLRFGRKTVKVQVEMGIT